jgi:hypothetical protein
LTPTSSGFGRSGSRGRRGSRSKPTGGMPEKSHNSKTRAFRVSTAVSHLRIWSSRRSARGTDNARCAFSVTSSSLAAMRPNVSVGPGYAW